MPWDGSSRPHRAPSGPEVDYSDQGRRVGQHLIDVHDMLHDAIEGVDRALVHHISHREDFDSLQAALDLLTDTLLSHLSYEEFELVEPLARLGFHPGQV